MVLRRMRQRGQDNPAIRARENGCDAGAIAPGIVPM